MFMCLFRFCYVHHTFHVRLMFALSLHCRSDSQFLWDFVLWGFLMLVLSLYYRSSSQYLWRSSCFMFFCHGLLLCLSVQSYLWTRLGIFVRNLDTFHFYKSLLWTIFKLRDFRPFCPRTPTNRQLFNILYFCKNEIYFVCH